MADGYWECLMEAMDEYAKFEPYLSDEEQLGRLQGIADVFTDGDLSQLGKILREAAV